ncbi:MAG: hypothetical protein E7181_02625 [Erysipelotrichaceae bacterium]|nr:hypothetical protein [Erysipelotrichaceae bacterium]
MDTVQKYGIKKTKAIFLFLQMLLIIVITATALYLLAFAIGHNLGLWMIVSYSFILLSTLVIIAYGMIGFKKGEIAYILAIAPFLGAILVNILLPQRDTFQVAVLSILFALTSIFMVKQKDKKFNSIVSILMCAVALTFSIYSAITARLDFLGQMSAKWYTYFAMYLSIFIPSIMSGTFALTYNVKITKEQNKQ